MVYLLIDFHTHIFPDAIADAAMQALCDGIHRIQGADYGAGKPLYFRAGTRKALEDSMPASGVTRSICLPIATKPAQTAHINDYAETVRSDTLLSFGTLHPADENWESVLNDLAERGFRGIKLHLQFQRYPIDGKECLRILKKAEALGLYVVFHAGEDIGLPPPVYASPRQIHNVLQETDGSHLIAAHLGGWRQWEDVLKYLCGTNIRMDTAYIREFIDPQLAKEIIRAHGAEKILFGSDSPWEDPADTLRFLQSLDLTQAELDAITYKNAQHLLEDTSA